MRRNSKRSKGLRYAVIAMAATGMAAASSVQAKPNSTAPTGNPANVVAHVTFSRGPATRMLACGS
jgi:hypothetical protein